MFWRFVIILRDAFFYLRNCITGRDGGCEQVNTAKEQLRQQEERGEFEKTDIADVI